MLIFVGIKIGTIDQKKWFKLPLFNFLYLPFEQAIRAPCLTAHKYGTIDFLFFLISQVWLQSLVVVSSM